MSKKERPAEKLKPELIEGKSTKQRHDVKVQASVGPRCSKCKIIRRRGVVYVICDNPRHKQRQG